MWLCLLGSLFVIRGFLTVNSLSFGSKYKSDLCILKLNECNEKKVQLSPFKTNGFFMFSRHSDLDKTCRSGSNFFSCMKDAEKLCEDLPLVSERILENRQFAKSVCDKKGTWRKWYIANSYCINYFFLHNLDHCAMIAIRNVSREYQRGTTEFTCRFYVEVRKCRTTMAEKYCGIVASEVLGKLLLYHRDYDFMCVYMKKEHGYSVTPLSIDDNTKTQEDENELKNINLNEMDDNLIHEKASTSSPEDIPEKVTQSYIKYPQSDTRTPENEITTDSSYTDANHESSSNVVEVTLDSQHVLKKENHLAEESMTHETKLYLNENETSLRRVGQFAFNTSTHTHYTPRTNDDLSNLSVESYSNGFKTFGLYEIFDQGAKYYLGCGLAMISRTTDSPLENMYCTWLNNADEEKMFKCSVHIPEACLFREEGHYSKGLVFDLAYRTILLMYTLDNETYLHKASIRMKYYKPNVNAFPPGYASHHIQPTESYEFDDERPTTEYILGHKGEQSTTQNYSDTV